MIQLVKYIADSGICSRREAVELVRLGKISINGHKILEPAALVGPEDHVTYNRKVIKPVTKVYFMLNKPTGYVTSHSDEKGRAVVFDLIPQAKKMKLITVGRLDRETSGLLLITNDGDWAHGLTHPRFEIRKKYEAVLDKPITSQDRAKLAAGFRLYDGFIKPDSVQVLGYGKAVVLTLHSGKNRIVRRMLEHIGYHVVTLERVAFGGIILKGLPTGRHRRLTKQEMARLAKPQETGK